MNETSPEQSGLFSCPETETTVPITFDAPGLAEAIVTLTSWDASTIDTSTLSVVANTDSPTAVVRATITATIQTADLINVLNTVAGTVITPVAPSTSSSDGGTDGASSARFTFAVGVVAFPLHRG